MLYYMGTIGEKNEKNHLVICTFPVRATFLYVVHITELSLLELLFHF